MRRLRKVFDAFVIVFFITAIIGFIVFSVLFLATSNFIFAGFASIPVIIAIGLVILNDEFNDLDKFM